jgi:hypothetical protein
VTICLLGDVGLVDGPVSWPNEVGFGVTTWDCGQVARPGADFASLLDSPESIGTKGVPMALPLPRDPIPSPLVTPPDNVSIVRTIWSHAEHVIGVVRRPSKDCGG